MRRRPAIVSCLVFSGLTALVYQIVWTRLLGLAFGTTTEAVSLVLAVFFGGLALGNALAARWLPRVERPLRVYALLELGVGAFALLSLPILGQLDAIHAWSGLPPSGAARLAVYGLLSVAVLLPPTVAMGATLPVVASGLVDRDGTLGRWSAILYAANTCGAVLGAYVCGFQLIPRLGLSTSVIGSALLNLAVAGAVLVTCRNLRVPRRVDEPLHASARATSRGVQGTFLALFGISGFVAIGYEIVWTKVFGIVMEGTLYGFAAVLSAYLLGITLGSLAIAPRVDRIRDLPRTFALLHVAIAICVALGIAAVPYLPFAYARIASLAGGEDAIHLLYVLILPLILAPTALFGAAFPVLVRIVSTRARDTGRAMGMATAVNTAGSIAASLVLGFWWIPVLGSDASLYALILIDLAAALYVLLRFQEGPKRARLRALAGATAVLATVALGYGGVRIEEAIAGRQLVATSLASYRRGLDLAAADRALTIEGRSAVVTVYTPRDGRLLRTNGLPEAGFHYVPPHLPLETVALGLVPYLVAPDPQNALVVGLGGGNTLTALLRTPLDEVEVVELERGVIEAVDVLHEGRVNPLHDPRVLLHVDDGRHALLTRARGGGRGLDLIVSQPSHPWRIGAANLFTEDFFEIASEALAPRGVFALWVNGFRIDPAALLAIVSSFDRVFPGAVLFDIGAKPRSAFLLVGSHDGVSLDLDRMRGRMADTAVAALLARYGIDRVEDVLARVEGPTAAFAALSPGAANTDDNAFVEMRIPRRLNWERFEFGAIEARLPDASPQLPPIAGELDPAALGEALLRTHEGPAWPYAGKLARLLAQRSESLTPFDANRLRALAQLRNPEAGDEPMETLRALGRSHRERPEPLRDLGEHLAKRGEFEKSAEAFAAAHARSGEARDAYAAGHALERLDPDAANRWFARIPDTARDAFPALVLHDARRALARRASPEEMRALYARLSEHRDTSNAWNRVEAEELLSRLSWALNDPNAARAHADASGRLRGTHARALLDQTRIALAASRYEDAHRALAEAQRWLPSEGEIHALRARLAHAEGDAAALEAALHELHRWAPDPNEAIAAENRLRSQLSLPLVTEAP